MDYIWALTFFFVWEYCKSELFTCCLLSYVFLRLSFSPLKIERANHKGNRKMHVVVKNWKLFVLKQIDWLSGIPFKSKFHPFNQVGKKLKINQYTFNTISMLCYRFNQYKRIQMTIARKIDQKSSNQKQCKRWKWK